MSTQPQSSDDELTDEEQDLLDVAGTDVPSAKHARTILREKYDYSEGELP